jgi:hypothetical protein
MKRARSAFGGPSVAIVVALGTCALSPSAEAHDLSGVLGDFQDLFNSCASTGQMYVDVNFTLDMFGPSKVYYGQSFASGSDVSCSEFTWFKRPLFNRPNNNVSVSWGGPNFTTAGQCDHTTVVYGVFKKFSSGGGWSLISLGMIYGEIQSGKCTYSYTAAGTIPSRWHIEEGEYGMAPWTSVYGGNQNQGFTEVGEIRVAVYSWAHNHSGTLCSEANCYYQSGMSAW